MSGNCVDGVCCAQTAAQCAGTCKSCNVAGMAGTCPNVPAGLPDDTCPSDQPATRAQQCKTRLGQACNVFTECASGNCADGVCCDTACNDKCKQCNLAGKRGTCSFVPSGEEDPVGAPACVSEPDVGSASATAPVPAATSAEGDRQAVHRGRPVHEQQSASTASAATAPARRPATSCDKPGAVGSCSVRSPIGQPDQQRDHALRRTDQSCNGSGTCVTAKKPNGAMCQAATRVRQRTTASISSCCSGTCTGTCQSCAVPGFEGSCVNVPARRAGHERDARPAAAPSIATLPASASRASSRTAPRARPAPSAARTSASTMSAATPSAARTCYTCNLPGGTPGECAGLPTGTIGSRVRVASTSATACTTARPARSRTARSAPATSSARRTRASTAPAVRAACRAASAAPARTPPAPARGGRRDGSRMDCKGEGACTAPATARASAACASAGAVLRAGRLPGDHRRHHRRGNLRRRRATARRQDQDCRRLPLLHRHGRRSRSAGRTARRIPSARSTLLPSMNDGGAGCRPTVATGSTCPAVFDARPRLRARHAVQLAAVQRWRLLQHQLRPVRQLQHPATLGTCIPIPAGTDPDGECQDSASDPSGMCGGCATATPAARIPPAGRPAARARPATASASAT